MDAPGVGALDAVEARRRKMFALIAEIGLTREERIELAEMLLHHDVASYKDLDDAQRCRILDALEGYVMVDVLLALRPPSGSGRLQLVPRT